MITIKADVEKISRKLDKFQTKLEDNMVDRLEVAGSFLEKEMLHKIDAGLSPALTESTVARRKKQSSVPLFDTEELYDQIDHKRGFDSVEVGVFGSRASIAKHHEFGAPKAGIPERSFMRSAFNENKKKIVKIMSDKN